MSVLDRGSRPRLGGLIGSELLSRYTLTIDYERRTLTLNSPGFKPSSAKFSLPLGLAMSPDGLSHPSISAEIDGVTGEFMIDTGAGGQIVISEKFQQEHSTFGPNGTVLRFVSPGGIGGPASIHMGFGKQLRIGSFVLSQPMISGIDRGNSSMGRTSYVSGLIGNGILSNFIVTIDVAGTRAYFEPVDRPHATTLFGTGMILNKPSHDSFEVLDVLKDTAAERAGLHRGDRISDVEGHPARDLALSDVHSMSATTRAALTVLPADHRKLDLTFSRLLP
jgi:hypothetical protein